MFRKHLKDVDPFVEMKEYNFLLSAKATDVLIAQLNTDISQQIYLPDNKSTIEQQFNNYMEVRRNFQTRKRLHMPTVFSLGFFLDFSVG